MKHVFLHLACIAVFVSVPASASVAEPASAPLGLPPVPIPADNPQSTAKVALGDKLFHDARFSSTGQVSCATCHDAKKGFTDHKRVSEGIHGLTGTRNAPTVINAAYFTTQFWDGREPSLEEQSKQPFVNPVEMGLKNHGPILAVVRGDPEYVRAFQEVFGVAPEGITMEQVKRAIASFERTVVAGDSPFDRYWFGGDPNAMNEAQRRGLKVFLGQGRCVSCHVIEQTQALFTDNRFHNLGVGFKRIREDVNRVAQAFLEQKAQGVDVDVAVLTGENLSELGRFAVSGDPTEVGAFKTSTLRNVTATGPYMHDGSIATLKEVVEFYNNGGRVDADDPVDDFQSGGIRPLNLDKQQKADLVAFLRALTSPEYQGVTHIAQTPSATSEVQP